MSINIKDEAEKIAADLFTTGSNMVGDHLQIVKGVPPNAVYLAGWCQQAVADRIESALSALCERVQGEWLPIESAPEMRTVILWADTGTPEVPNWRMGSGFFHREMRVWVWEGEQVRDWARPPTHWRPLPPPPVSKGR